MKILLASPNFPQPRGNTVTVKRIAAGLEKLGVETEIISTTGDIAQPLPPADVVHGFHAYHFYKFLQKLEQKPPLYTLSLTGTDLNQDLFKPERRSDVLTCLKDAQAVHVFDEKAKDTLTEEAPELGGKVHVIPQGNSWFPPSEAPVDKEPHTFLFLLPAGIRKVKNIPAAISMLEELRASHPELRLWLVGPVLEEEEGKAVLEMVEDRREWISYLGQLPHEKMGSLYKKADVVLNTSQSEGQPAAILEAMGYGVAVLASNIQGNRSIISNEKTGFLYKNRNEFLDYAGKLMNNNLVKQTIGRSAKQYIDEFHSSDDEAKAFLRMYQSVLD
ncbi:glycosyltransferase [Planococcus salinus]|uniref:glycosyltransferase n=1 Tax=Planococcus salinus TaxID=1848460 RepID=UPI00186419AB|nr:glycosyltransferase [Planococcus salinus]